MNVYLGYDRREDAVFQVARSTLLATTAGVTPIPLIQDSLRAYGLYTRPIDQRASTDFSLTRFLVPYLTLGSSEPWALFVDCDFLFTRDLRKVLDPLLDETKAVMVVKHDYVPRNQTKMGGSVQHTYPRKNWSSFIAWNLRHEANNALSANMVNSADPSWLHQFQWLDDAEIGNLPVDLNFLVGEYEAPEESVGLTKATSKTPTCLHYTLGIGPFVPPVQDYAALWGECRKRFVREPSRGMH